MANSETEKKIMQEIPVWPTNWPISLQEILEVVYVTSKGISVKPASYIVAARRGINSTAVMQRCTRDVNIGSIAEFGILIKDTDKLKKILSKRFPHHMDKIENYLNSFYNAKDKVDKQTDMENMKIDEKEGIKMEPKIESDIMEKLLINKGQIILYGPPGTGKTYRARKLAERFIKGEFNDLKDKGFIEFIAFHPSYGYEEFIERITVPIEREEELTESGKYELKAGIFKNLCKRALVYSIDRDFQVELQEKIIDKNSRISYRTKKEQISTIIEKGKFNDVSWRQIYDTYKKAKSENKVNFKTAPKFVLIVDEINRGYISKIFGELITLIEIDKRIGEDNELTASLLYSVDKFGVPPNVYIIGTMNTADRSIDLVDIALRRRFGFIEMLPDFSIVENDIKEREENLKSEGIYQLLLDSKSVLERINKRICDDEIGRDRQIGHSYILQIKTKNELIMAWQYNILPLLDEYCQGDCEKVNQILFGKDGTGWITEKDGIYKFKGNLTELGDFINQIT